jgi:hypothetical protein
MVTLANSPILIPPPARHVDHLGGRKRTARNHSDGSDEVDDSTIRVKKRQSRKASRTTIAANDLSDEFDEPAIRGRSKQTRKTSTTAGNDSIDLDDDDRSVLKDEFEYQVDLGDYMFPSTFPARQGNEAAFRKMCLDFRFFQEVELDDPSVKLPLFAYRTAEKPGDKVMFVNEGVWEKLIISVDEREKERHIAKKNGRKLLPKSLLPLTIEPVKPKPVRLSYLIYAFTYLQSLQANSSTNTKTKGKGSGRQWAGPRGTLSREPAVANPLGNFLSNSALRVALNEDDCETFALDRGERNDKPLAPGTLAHKVMSHADAIKLIKDRYLCVKHGNTREEACCWIPKDSHFAGKHIRIDMLVMKTLAVHMVSHSILLS